MRSNFNAREKEFIVFIDVRYAGMDLGVVGKGEGIGRSERKD